MSMWDFDEEGNQDRQYRDPYASHGGSSDYHGSYGGHQSHSDHHHHNHGHDQHYGHGHSHSEHDDSYSYHGQRSRGSPSQQNYGSRHESYTHDHQGHGHDSYGNQRHEHGHESYVSPSYLSNNVQSPVAQSAHHGGGHQSYDMSAGYEVQEEHHPAPAPPPSAGHGHEAASRDLFTSDSVVNLTLDEIDALARTHRSRSWLVVLYAPWCRFCQVMEPNFERVAHYLEQSNVYVGRFRADGDYKEYAKRYLQLEHFPTVLFFPKDSSHIVKYQSENREVDALLGFVHAFE